MKRKQSLIRLKSAIKMKGVFPLLMIIPILILSVGCAVKNGSNRSQNFLKEVNAAPGKAEVDGEAATVPSDLSDLNKEWTQEWTEIESKYFKNGEYVIQKGDLISVSVFKNPEFSDQMKVRDDGRISLPTLGDVEAAGLTMKELESAVVERLSKRLNDPEVTVTLREEKPKLIYLLGEVKTEGPFLLNQCPTPLQGIIKAGGFTPTSDKKKALLLREFQGGNLKILKIDMSVTEFDFYKKRQNVKLQPNDIIIIPMNTIGSVNQWVDQYVSKTIGAILSVPGFVIQLLILDELLKD
jgi:polysaccharide export outer membrane protein